MQVEDEGEGFGWRACMGKAPQSMGGTGRGLTIMKRYSESITYNETGNNLVLIIKKYPI